MSRKTLGIVLIVAGVLIVVFIVLSHSLGLAAQAYGLKKIAGLVVGVVVALAGVWAAFIKKS